MLDGVARDRITADLIVWKWAVKAPSIPKLRLLGRCVDFEFVPACETTQHLNDLACFRFIDPVSLAVIGDLIGRLCVPLGLSIVDVMGHCFLPFSAKRWRGTDVPGEKGKTARRLQVNYAYRGMQRRETLLSRRKCASRAVLYRNRSSAVRTYFS
jgi:hypothetical protein